MYCEDDKLLPSYLFSFFFCIFKGGVMRANPIAIFALVHGMVVMEEVLGLTLESRGLAQSRLLMNHLRQTCMYSSSQIMYGKSGLKLVGTG